ncbi:MAG: cyclase family protein [bacterium]
MHIIDLSRPIHSGMEVYPGDPEVTVETVHTYESHGWLLRRLTLGAHTGTHMDAPSHMHPRGRTLSHLPAEQCMGPALCNHAGTEPLYPHGVGLLFARTVRNDELTRIIAARPPFVGGELDEAAERALLKEEIVTYTGLVNLELLPKGRQFTFIGLPLPIVDGEASPVRAVAIIESSD